MMLAVPSFADTLANYTLTGAGNSNVATLSGDGGATTVTGYAGRYTGQLGGNDINVFCVDLNHDINFGQGYAADVSHSISDASGAQNGDYFNGGLASALDSGYYNPGPGPLTNQQRADEVGYLIHAYDNAKAANFHNSYDLTTNETAVSLSIWDIIADGGDGLTHGKMVSDAGTASTYGSLVSNLETQAQNYKNSQFLDVTWIQAPTSGGLQGFGYTNYVAPVPEAGTVAIFGLMLIGGVLTLRTRGKQTANEPQA